jgi:hypothetical protein
MRALLPYALIVALVGVFVGQHYAGAATIETNTVESTRFTRTCIHATGAAEVVTATAAASDASISLIPNTRYTMVCRENAWVRWGTTAPTAASGDFFMPANVLWTFQTSDTLLFAAARNVTSDGSCYLLECR